MFPPIANARGTDCEHNLVAARAVVRWPKGRVVEKMFDGVSLLQWGPVCEDGESSRYPGLESAAATLQWGPVCEDGERIFGRAPLWVVPKASMGPRL